MLRLCHVFCFAEQNKESESQNLQITFFHAKDSMREVFFGLVTR